MRQLCLPAAFFLLTLFLDTLMTLQGTAGFADSSREGNFLVVWLWELLGPWRWTAPLWWIALVFLAGYVLWRARPFLGAWWLYGVGAGHAIGFLSWTPLNVLTPWSAGVDEVTLLAALVGLSGLLGLIITKIHFSYAKE